MGCGGGDLMAANINTHTNAQSVSAILKYISAESKTPPSEPGERERECDAARTLGDWKLTRRLFHCTIAKGFAATATASMP
jgi:hypothetical protein